MFKNYLRVQPVPIQLLIFLSFWCALMLLGLFIQPLYIKAVTGVGAAGLEHFVENDIYKYPQIIFVSNTLFQLFTFLLPALVYAYLADPSPRRYLGGVAPGKPVQIAIVALLAPCLVVGLSPLMYWLKQLDLGDASRALDERRDSFIQTYLSSANVWSSIRNVFLIAVVPAFCEELFFRATVLKFAYSLFRKWWVSILVSALLFAAFHTSISEFVPIFIAGLILGWVYQLTGSLWISVLLHLLFNGIQAVAGIYAGTETDKSLEQPSVQFMLFGVAFALVAACLFFLYRKRTPLPATWNVFVPDVQEGARADED